MRYSFIPAKTNIVNIKDLTPVHIVPEVRAVSLA